MGENLERVAAAPALSVPAGGFSLPAGEAVFTCSGGVSMPTASTGGVSMPTAILGSLSGGFVLSSAEPSCVLDFIPDTGSSLVLSYCQTSAEG